MTTTPAPQTDSRAELEARLLAYAPTELSPVVWAGIRDEAVRLVLDAGPLTWQRTRKDLGVIADVADHLSRGRGPVTLDAIFEDKALTAFDSAEVRAGAADGTRKNQRGRWRRLQAAHRDVPWRRDRREDGQRVADLVQPEVADRVARLLPGDGVPGGTGPRAVQAALNDARCRRRGLAGDAIDPGTWAAARAHARSQGTGLTRRDLHALTTYEVLAERVPAVSLIVGNGLTRRDLDHALVLAASLPAEPDGAAAALLRG